MNDGPAAAPYLSFSAIRRLPVILQATVSECGLACIAMIADYHGRHTDLTEMRRRYGASLRGATLESLVRVANGIGLSTRALRCSPAELRHLKLPCVLHWRFDHFVVLTRVKRRDCMIHDPARGAVCVSWQEIDRAFTGIALELSQKDRADRRSSPRRLRLFDVVSLDTGMLRRTAAAIFTALFCELLVLAMPFYLQVVIDRVVLGGDHPLLVVIFSGFFLLMLVQILALTLRQLLFRYLGQTLFFDMSTRLVDRLVNLPLAYFRQRSLGDVQARLQSLRAVQQFMTQSAPALVLDALFLVLVSFMLCLYDAQLALLALAVTAIYSLWRALVFGPMLRRSRELVNRDAEAQSNLLTTLRSMQTIRLAGLEATRISEWCDRLAARINAEIGFDRLRITDSAIQQLLFQGLHLVAVLLVAGHAIEGTMSIGALSAVITYLGMFAVRVGAIINHVVEYRLLQVPLSRMADIVFATDGDQERSEVPPADFSGAIELRGVGYRHCPGDPLIFDRCDLRVGRNEFIAVRGPSGAGKSSLLHLIAGIERPVTGCVFFDGRSAVGPVLMAARQRMGTVFEGDALLPGSIADNIALFDGRPDFRRIRRVANLAMIDADIESMPMGYLTQIGDMGAALSKGQVQRLLLARALYRRPVVLLLDEFTSGLDPDTERQVVNVLRRVEATRVVATHSDIVLRAADRVVEVRDGRLLAAAGHPAAAVS